MADLDAEALRESVADTTPPPCISELSDAFGSLFQSRDGFLWRWVYELMPAFRWDIVPDPDRESTRVQKTILTMWITTLDDLAEHRGDRESFEVARLSLHPSVNPSEVLDSTASSVDREVIDLATHLWQAFRRRFGRAKHARVIAPLLRFDLRQTMTAIEYASLSSDVPQMATPTGVNQFDVHNMAIFAYADIDLAHAKRIPKAELQTFREICWTLQRMARIGNWLSTWERELRDGDYSAKVIVMALRRGVITPSQLTTDQPSTSTLIRRIREAGVEKRLVQEWNSARDRLCRQLERLDLTPVSSDTVLEGAETILRYHMATRGFK
jgi:hypothetical protein